MSPSPWSVNTVLLVTVFLVTSGLVYYWGRVGQRTSASVPSGVERASFPHEAAQHAEQVYAEAAAAAEQARHQWQQAEAAKQRYVDRHLQQQIAEHQQRSSASTSEVSTVPPDAVAIAPPHPSRVQNPEWTRLNESLRRLNQRRAHLLLERTPAHPEVLEVSDELAEIERAMADVPRWLSATPPEGTPEVRPPVTPSPKTADTALVAERAAERHAQFRMELTRLNRYAEESRQRYEQLAARERDAWAVWLQQREAEFVPVSATETLYRDTADNMLLSTALLAGMAMMVGVGMFATGASMESPVKSASQVSSLLQVPVVATVTLPGLRPAISGRHRGWLRLASCLGGATLMASCIGLVYRALVG